MAKLTKKEISPLVERLEELYPKATCALDFDTVFHLLVAVMLSAQTTDKSVNKVTPLLFQKHPDPASIASMDQQELETILQTIGMYRTKAKNLKALCIKLNSEYNGEVPEDYDALVSLPGVGRKTANVVLAVGFGWQRIPVDTHVFRLANRIGLVEEKDVLKTEYALMEILPEEKWTHMHHALIWHGREVCIARKPKCEACGISEFCKKNGVTPDKGKSNKEKKS